MNIIKYNKIWLTLSGIAVILSLALFFFWKLNLGIDFTGGSLMEIEFGENRPQSPAVSALLLESGLLKSINAQLTGDNGMILRFETITEETHQQILNKLNETYNDLVTEIKYDSIGPIIGKELQTKTVWAIIISLAGMIIYIAVAFIKVSKPVPSWQYGVISMITLFHNIIITIGIFSILGHFYQVEVNAAFIAALLTILGYSINDTIVIFDRIRENLKRYYEGDFESIVKKSINESLTRSLYTGFATLLTLFSILLFGGETIRDFVLALIIGIVIGTYASIFLASPLLVIFQKIFKEKEG